MKRLLYQSFDYLFISKQKGWMNVLLHDAAVLLMFFAITQMGSIILLGAMFLGVAPRGDEEILEDVVYFVVSFTPLIAVVYGCVLMLRCRDHMLTSKRPHENLDKTQHRRNAILFPSFWQGVLERVNRFRWWEYYLYLPIALPMLVLAAACLFPTLAAIGLVAVISCYSYMAYVGEIALDSEWLSRWAHLLLIVTVGEYVAITFGLIEESLKKRFSSSESDSMEQDMDTNVQQIE